MELNKKSYAEETRFMLGEAQQKQGVIESKIKSLQEEFNSLARVIN